MAAYASWAVLDGSRPKTGRGKETTKVRVAVAGIELSKDLVVSILVSFSTNGQRISFGAFKARGPILWRVSSRYKEVVSLLYLLRAWLCTSPFVSSRDFKRQSITLAVLV